ncbi:hypothetical protein AB0395_14825 [Streptosporangium sp. NPDC051023]|uniref:hypothetical protein n=1 Tax=Streptosporangium sp. NPDC051023 TaxID=3155410 RepID=UPI00344CDF5D
MNKRTIAAIAGMGLIVGTLALGGSGALASDRDDTPGEVTAATATPQPPQGARAVVQLSPNPAKAGQEVTITGNCGGGKKLSAVASGYGSVTALENVQILNDDPNGFVAKGTVSSEIGGGVGPVFVDCDGEAGVALLVTHV